MFLSKKTLTPILGFCLITLSACAAEPNAQQKNKRVFYNPYCMLLGRTALNVAGAAISCLALEKSIPDNYLIAKELGQISSILYFIGRQSYAYQKFEHEKRTWCSIQRCNEAIKKFNKSINEISKKYANA